MQVSLVMAKVAPFFSRDCMALCYKTAYPAHLPTSCVLSGNITPHGSIIQNLSPIKLQIFWRCLLSLKHCNNPAVPRSHNCATRFCEFVLTLFILLSSSGQPRIPYLNPGNRCNEPPAFRHQPACSKPYVCTLLNTLLKESIAFNYSATCLLERH